MLAVTGDIAGWLMVLASGNTGDAREKNLLEGVRGESRVRWRRCSSTVGVGNDGGARCPALLEKAIKRDVEREAILDAVDSPRGIVSHHQSEQLACRWEVVFGKSLNGGFVHVWHRGHVRYSQHQKSLGMASFLSRGRWRKEEP
jgi:hypothetical protein